MSSNFYHLLFDDSGMYFDTYFIDQSETWSSSFHHNHWSHSTNLDSTTISSFLITEPFTCVFAQVLFFSLHPSQQASYVSNLLSYCAAQFRYRYFHISGGSAILSLVLHALLIQATLSNEGLCIESYEVFRFFRASCQKLHQFWRHAIFDIVNSKVHSIVTAILYRGHPLWRLMVETSVVVFS